MVLLLLRVQMLALFVTRVGFLLCVLCCLLAFFLFCFVCRYIACCDVHLRLLSLRCCCCCYCAAAVAAAVVTILLLLLLR